MSADKAKLREAIKSALDKLEEMTDDPDEKAAWDAGLDFLEELVAATRTKIDDIVCKPIFAIFRRRYDIPDND